MNWRFIINKPMSASENMAIDEAIMTALSHGKAQPTIRFYDWIVPTLSFGYHQNAEKEIDFQEVHKKRYDFIRRPTGGRMVLHKNEVTYSVIAPIQGRLSGNFSNSYREISFALADGLRKMGISEVELEKGEISPHLQRQASNPCFSSSSRYEIKFQNKKIIGSAQVRKNNVLLQHGSILLNENQAEIADFIPNLEKEKKKKLKIFLNKKTIAINQILEKKITFASAVKYFQESFRRNWNGDDFIISENITSYEQNIAIDLAKNKYEKDSWNFKKKLDS